MRTIYIDNEYKCHVTDDGTMTAVETAFFDGKCDAYVEGFRFIPEGKSWTREDGTVFEGEMVSAWKDYRELKIVQEESELTAPISYDGSMALEDGKHYTQNGVTYRCIWSSGVPIHDPLADMVGLYVEVVS